tara:strand:+ start:2774 stop:2992 length:219 start_codon:yes stop_codon:yes gene_type:complete
MKYYEASVKQVLEIPTNKGTKSKVLRDRLLVEGESITYVESKVNKMMKDNPNEWEITSIKESRIVEVIHSEQ